MTDKKLNIHAALLKFHKEFMGAKKSGHNLHFKSKYFTLDDLVEATTPVLQKCGLYVMHFVDAGCLTTMIRTDDGTNVASTIELPPTTNPQIMGSNLTYFKKYNLTGLLNIPEASDLDDDGNLGADAANLGEAAKNERKARPPQELATKEQLAGLNDYMDKYEMSKRQSEYIVANIDRLTIGDAGELLAKLNLAVEAGTLKEKTDA